MGAEPVRQELHAGRVRCADPGHAGQPRGEVLAPPAEAALLELTDEAKEFLVKKGTNTDYGARPLRRAVEHYLEDPLAEALLRGEVKDGEPVIVAREGDKLIFKQKTPPTAPSGVTP